MPRNKSTTKILQSLHGMEFLSTKLSDHQFPTHFHDTFVIQLISSGADRTESAGEAQIAQRGELFIHGPGLVHSGGPVGDQPLAYRAIYPSVELTCRLLEIEPEDIPRAYSTVISDRTTVKAATNALDKIDSAPNSDDAAKLLTELMTRVLDESENRGTQRMEQPTAIEAARAHLETNFDRDVTVAELSDVVGLSRFHLIREFKRSLGITPRQFLISQRVTVAKSLLTSNRPLVDVALESGFSDQSHLNRCFKRVTAVSPGQYKAAANSNSVQELSGAAL